jgi:hypothetical protein
VATAAKSADRDRPQSRPIKQAALRRAEEVRNAYRLILAEGTSYEDLLSTDAARLAAPIGPFLTRGDTIEVIDEAGTFFAWLLVAEHVQGQHVRFVELVRRALPGEEIDQMEGTGQWRGAWGGFLRQYCLVRPTGGVMLEGLRTREEAGRHAHERNRPEHRRETLG